MKKIICMVLALVMVMVLSVTAMAEDTYSKPDGKVTIVDSSQQHTETIPVPAKGSVAEFNKNNETYYVIMDWSVESTLTYTVNATDYKWNVYNVDNSTETLLTGKTPDTDKTATMGRYDVNGKWSGKATITVNVTNWSNVNITATPEWKNGEKTVADAANDNGVSENIDLKNKPTQTPTTINRADEDVTAAGQKDSTATSANVFDLTIDNTSEAPANANKITSGAIRDTKDKYSAIIGTLTVKIEKASTTTGGGN